jgi:hypothetical protein
LPVGVSNSQTGTNYTLYLNGTATSTTVPGTGSAISFGNQTNAGTYTVVASPAGTTCTVNMNGNAVITVDPQVPNVPAAPVGSMYPESGTVVNYTTTGATYATSYSWSVTPANAGTFTGSTTTGTITWSSSFTGQANINVKGANSCGESAISSLTVDVVAVGIKEVSNKKLVSIYPNPAKDVINLVSGKSMTADILMANTVGVTIIDLKDVSLDGIYRLDISKITPGIYFITIKDKENKQISKIIVE